jgi:hypothetical protein
MRSWLKLTSPNYGITINRRFDRGQSTSSKKFPETVMKQYRADLPAWIFIGGLSSLPWFIFWVNSVRDINLTALAIAIAKSGFTFLWLSSFRIVITPAGIIFRSLFRGQQELKLEEIKMVRLTWKFWQTRKGPLRIVVEPRDRNSAHLLEINAKVFSREAINAVLELGARVGEADDGGLRDGIVLRNWRKE